MPKQGNLFTTPSIDQLVLKLKQYNKAYRLGAPEISDRDYDDLIEELRRRDEHHPYLHTVEPESNIKGDSVKHRKPMLSLEKAYTVDQLQRFVDRVEKAAADLNIITPLFRVTPKLDGMAGVDDGHTLASRGNGLIGSNITHIFDRGVIPIGGRGLGLGEIVMSLSYFNQHFAGEFTHPRNMVTGSVNADEVKPGPARALEAGQVHFVPYSELAKQATWVGDGKTLVAEMEKITQDLLSKVDYPLDGMVAEAIEPAIHAAMGSTAHHNRWQIAIKTRGETAETIIEEIGWQTGRTGAITPVLRVRPTLLSGATISNVTAHHAGMVRDKRLGTGAKIIIIRSGEVIPKLESVVEPARHTSLIESCPSCNSPLHWDNDFLRCKNHNHCPAQTETGIRHWFRITGSADGFGPKTIEKMVAGGFGDLKSIYSMTINDFLGLGLGEKQSENLIQAMMDSTKTPIEDARFLAAFGIPNLGIGDSRKLLAVHPIANLGEIREFDLRSIKGFGEKTSKGVSDALRLKWPLISHMMALGFVLEATPINSDQPEIESPFAGKKIMFTGKMSSGSRSEMQAKARALGAQTLSGISSKLDLLVIGEKPSPGKLSKGEALNIEIITEAEWLERLEG